MDEYKLKPGKIGEKVIGAYKKVEDTVVGGYKKVEDTVVEGYKKVEDAFVDAFLEKVPPKEDTAPGAVEETPTGGDGENTDKAALGEGIGSDTM